MLVIDKTKIYKDKDHKEYYAASLNGRTVFIQITVDIKSKWACMKYKLDNPIMVVVL